MPSKTVSVRLKPETLEKLDAMAEAMQRPRTWLMVHAIEQYVANAAWQVAAIQQAVDELEQGQADLVDHEEVAKWLDSWGTDNEAEPFHETYPFIPRGEKQCSLPASTRLPKGRLGFRQ